jgi:hypothetical protein
MPSAFESTAFQGFALPPCLAIFEVMASEGFRATAAVAGAPCCSPGGVRPRSLRDDIGTTVGVPGGRTGRHSWGARRTNSASWRHITKVGTARQCTPCRNEAGTCPWGKSSGDGLTCPWGKSSGDGLTSRRGGSQMRARTLGLGSRVIGALPVGSGHSDWSQTASR